MRVKPEPRRWLFIQTSAWFFLLCHRVWWENVKEEDVASYRQLWSCFAERDVMEQRREFSKEIKEGGGKVIKQYRTVFVSQGFLFFLWCNSSFTPVQLDKNTNKLIFFFLLTIWMKKGEQKSVMRQASSSCSSPCSWASASIHSSVEPFTHNYVNYIPLQCHMFAVTSHTTTANNEQTERRK